MSTLTRWAATCMLFGVLPLSQGAELPPEMAEPGSAVGAARAPRVKVGDSWKPREGSIRILTEDEPVTVSLTFPHMTRSDDQLVVMRFRLRMVTPTFGGWSNYLCIGVNGTPVSSYTAAGHPRLLNRRGPSMKTSSAKWPNEAYFKRVQGSAPALLTVFGPDWDSLEPRFIVDRQELYWFVLDITDLVREEGDNGLTFTNVALARYFKKTVEQMKDMPMLIDRLEIGLADAAVRDRLVEDLDAGMARFEPAVSAEQDGVTVAASAGGALRITYGGDRYYCRSTFSEAGKTIRYNRFWWTPTRDWQVTTKQAGARGFAVTGRTVSYEIQRTVEHVLPLQCGVRCQELGH